MDAALDMCEARVRANNEKKQWFEHSWQFDDWTNAGLYLAKEVQKKKKTLSEERTRVAADPSAPPVMQGWVAPEVDEEDEGTHDFQGSAY